MSSCQYPAPSQTLSARWTAPLMPGSARSIKVDHSWLTVLASLSGLRLAADG